MKENSVILIEMLERSFKAGDLVKVDILISKLTPIYSQLGQSDQVRIDSIKEQSS